MFIFWDQYHPDMNKNPGAEEKFKEISAAYEVILPSSTTTMIFFIFSYKYLSNRVYFWIYLRECYTIMRTIIILFIFCSTVSFAYGLNIGIVIFPPS